MKTNNLPSKNYNLNLKKFLATLGISNPKNLSIYVEALTHKSYANENNLNYNYERLEFLGDAAIDWVVTNHLFHYEKQFDEGALSRARSNLVKKETLAKCCKELHLDEYIIMGNGAKNNVSNESIYEDVFESLMGAIARDQGIKKVVQILQNTLIKHYHSEEFNTKDFKTLLQEYLQSKGSHPPKYVKKTDDNAKIKIVEVWFDDLKYGEGQGASFKDAEQEAAASALKKMAQ